MKKRNIPKDSGCACDDVMYSMCDEREGGREREGWRGGGEGETVLEVNFQD